MERQEQKLSWFNNMKAPIAGAFSGCITRALTQPLDCSKVRLQLQVEPVSNVTGARYTGTWQTLFAIFRDEGYHGLWWEIQGQGNAQQSELVFFLGKDTFPLNCSACSTAWGSSQPTISWTVPGATLKSLGSTSTATSVISSAVGSLELSETQYRLPSMSFARESLRKTTAADIKAWRRFVLTRSASSWEILLRLIAFDFFHLNRAWNQSLSKKVSVACSADWVRPSCRSRHWLQSSSGATTWSSKRRWTIWRASESRPFFSRLRRLSNHGALLYLF